MAYIEEIKSRAIENGWAVSLSESDTDVLMFEFSKFTPFGQDFNFSVNMDTISPGSLIANLWDYYQSFDPDYEASLWIGEDGHGKNGAPYHIKDIVKDMEDAENMIHELYEALVSIDDDN